MLTLERRPCDLGGDYSGKVEEKDGQVLRTLTFGLATVMLDERELNALLSEPHGWTSLKNDGPLGIVPFLRCFKSLEFEKTIDAANVRLMYGLDLEQEFSEVKLSKIKLTLCDGGMTALSCKVTTAPTLDETLAQLFEHFGQPIECEIRAMPPGAQQDLPLNNHGTGEQPAAPPKAAARKSRGRGKGRDGAILQ